jgi:hypothetical protein
MLTSHLDTRMPPQGPCRVGIDPDMLISLAIPVVLLAAVGGKVLGSVWHELGDRSQDLFRGDRLPILDWPLSTPPQG